MTIKPSRELVLKKVRDCFPTPARERLALSILDGYGSKPWHQQKERVQLALLKTASADLDKLAIYTEGAKTDFRDTLMPAEYYEESQSSSKTPAEEMVAVRRRDLEDYRRWLTLSVASGELVRRKATDCFPDMTVAEEALKVLGTYGIEMWHRERERTQVAILRLCCGDLNTLVARTQDAQSDFRGTLFLAECGQESKLGPHLPTQQLATVRDQDLQTYEAWLVSHVKSIGHR